jgi:tetratricopeptide (TPR) repeat protein
MNLAQFHLQLQAQHPSASTVAPRTVEAIYAAGHWLLEQEQPANAAKVFRVMLHAAPRDERAWLGLGECHARIGQHRIALELFGAGSVVAGPSPRCEIARGRALRALERDGEAEDAFERAMDLADAADDEALFAVARAERGAPS